MTSKFITEKSFLKSGLYIVSTPIGNLQDITFRAVDTLNKVDIIACEDTRVSKILLTHYNISTPTISIHNYNESDKIDLIKSKLKQGLSIALISDAGTPLISDPGFKIVKSLKNDGYYITCVPGPSSPIAALSISGMPTDKFKFIGFLPAKQQEKISIINEVKYDKNSVIFFETANRLLNTLSILKDLITDRSVAIIREITKIYEEVKIGNPAELIEYFTYCDPKGEFVCIITPYKGNNNISTDKIKNSLAFLLKYMSLKEASEYLSTLFEIPKKNVYNIGIEIKRNKI